MAGEALTTGLARDVVQMRAPVAVSKAASSVPAATMTVVLIVSIAGVDHESKSGAAIGAVQSIWPVRRFIARSVC